MAKVRRRSCRVRLGGMHRSGTKVTGAVGRETADFHFAYRRLFTNTAVPKIRWHVY